MLNSRSFFSQNEIQFNNGGEALLFLGRAHDECIQFYTSFKNAVNQASAKKINSPEGVVYQIQESDFNECMQNLNKLEEKTSTIFRILSSHANLPVDGGQKLKEAFEEKEGTLKRNLVAAKSEIFSPLMGLKFLKDHPTPQARRYAEYDYECASSKFNMFGFT